MGMKTYFKYLACFCIVGSNYILYKSICRTSRINDKTIPPRINDNTIPRERVPRERVPRKRVPTERVPPGSFSPSLRSVTTSQQTNYSILTGALPNFINQTMYMDGNNSPVNVPKAWGYMFQLVIATAAWRRLNFHTIVVVTVDYKHVTPPARRVMKYIDSVLKSFNASVVYFDVPSHMKVRLSQVSRIAAGQLHFVNDNDVLFTDDADMWPMGAGRYSIPAGKSIYVAEHRCCGKFRHVSKRGYVKEYREYPMSSIGMFARTWKAVYGKLIDVHPKNNTNIYPFKSLRPLITRLEDFARVANVKDIYTSGYYGRGYNLDQRLASFEIHEYLHDNGHKHLAYQTNYSCMTVHLGRTNGWQVEYLNNRHKCIDTIHYGTFRPMILDPEAWEKVRIIFHQFFGRNSSLVDFLEIFRSTFVGLLKN